MTNIFIANLDWDITSEDLHTTFSTFGTVTLAHVVYDNKTKKSKGFAYVEMEEVEGAIAAIQALNGMEINGRKIDVKIASPKTNRPPKKEVVAKPKATVPGKNFKPRNNNQSGSGNPRNNNYNKFQNNRGNRS
ncbi:MAG: hypothetical protein J0G96_06610 [Flavobacteriia bacterium]|nr:hypothetical protein [Flavobacteriia bacterium]OJX38500.1 MAG: hypothetical protein BGO87_10300 [Flavobacteriia bacterium 40-80]